MRAMRQMISLNVTPAMRALILPSRLYTYASSRVSAMKYVVKRESEIRYEIGKFWDDDVVIAI